MLSNGATGRMSDQVRGLKAQCVHQTQQVVGQVPGTGDYWARPRAADATVIVQNHAKMPGEFRDLGMPELATAAQSGHQQQRFAGAVLLHIQLGVAD
jgi:hypothetical protein